MRASNPKPSFHSKSSSTIRASSKSNQAISYRLRLIRSKTATVIPYCPVIAPWARSGYNADSLSGHPGDISTFPALLGLCSSGGNALSVAAYHAYRLGARERFAGGAEMLYRRSNEDPSYLPDSAGLPDVAMGGLGLAELARPGVLDRILAAPL